MPVLEHGEMAWYRRCQGEHEEDQVSDLRHWTECVKKDSGKFPYSMVNLRFDRKKMLPKVFLIILNLHIYKCSEKKVYQNLTVGKGHGQGHSMSKHGFV